MRWQAAQRRSLPHAVGELRTLGIPWRWIGLALYVGLNVGLIGYFIRPGPHNGDWQLFSMLPEAVERGSIYDVSAGTTPFVWSPLMAPVLGWVTQAIGYWPWLGLHVAALLLLRDWRLVGLVVISWAFWTDAVHGNTMTFIFVAGALAFRGSRPAAIVYLALCLLVPRPVMAPLALWLLWKDRGLWLPLGLMLAVTIVLVVGSGYAVEWFQAVAFRAHTPENYGPARFVGLWWLLAGIPIGAWLTLRGHVGWAGIAVSPYVIAYYWMMPLVDLARPRVPRAVSDWRSWWASR